MAPPFIVVAMLLGALPGVFVHALSSNACLEMPYTTLQNYEPAKEWCSSRNGYTAANPSAPCEEDDFLCPIFSELKAAAPTIASSFCSCIDKSTTTTTRTSTATGTLKTTRTSRSPCRTLTPTSKTSTSASRTSSSASRTSISATKTSISASRTSTGTSCGGSPTTTIITTVTTTEPANTATVTTTITEPTDTTTVTTTITPPANITTATTTLTLQANTTTVTTTITPSVSITTVTSTITPSANTTTVTATVTTFSCTTSTSTAPTGPPTCTPAGTPSGTCAYAADYNSGTGPQLWAGAAASLDACAVLCAGEPGCRSFAYNPGGTLQCVLFNTVTTGLTTTADSKSSTSFYDSTCFTCSGSAPRPPADDNCSPALQPPSDSLCDQAMIWAGGAIFELNAPGTEAASTGACEQLCLATSSCLSFSFDDTTCVLYSQTTFELELSGLGFPVDPGVEGSTVFYDQTCFVCQPPGCVCSATATKRELARREAGVSRREANVERLEAELSRRMLEMADRERALAEHA